MAGTGWRLAIVSRALTCAGARAQGVRPAAVSRNVCSPLHLPGIPSCCAMIEQRSVLSQVRWFSAKGASGGGGVGGGQNKQGKGKKDGKGKAPASAPQSAADKLHKSLLKEMQHELDGIKETHGPAVKIPKNWTRVNVDDFVNRGEEGVIAIRRQFPEYRVDIVTSTQLVTEDEDELAIARAGAEDDDEDEHDLVPEGPSAAMLVVLTRPGRGTPLVLECLANAESETTIVRVSVGIDQQVYLSSIYGPTTPLYVTYAAMWEQMLRSSGISHGDNKTDVEQLELWQQARKEYEEDSSTAATSPHFIELNPEFQEVCQTMVSSLLDNQTVEYLMDAMQEAEEQAYLNFLNRCAECVK